MFLIGCLFKSRAVFQNTHWSKQSTPEAEARHVKRLALFPAIYLKLVDRFGDQKAQEMYQRIALALGYALEQQAFDAFNLSQLSGLERFMAFRARMDKSEADRFNVKEYLTVNDTTCHYILKRCVAYDLFSEVGTPELTPKTAEEFFGYRAPEAAPE
jgi:L-2-amino-thiazoline-4-carboxylic acid hydrolase-like protein